MKPITSGWFLNYYLALRIKQKVNVANNFIQKVKTFSTNIDALTTHH